MALNTVPDRLLLRFGALRTGHLPAAAASQAGFRTSAFAEFTATTYSDVTLAVAGGAGDFATRAGSAIHFARAVTGGALRACLLVSCGTAAEHHGAEQRDEQDND